VGSARIKEHLDDTYFCLALSFSPNYHYGVLHFSPVISTGGAMNEWFSRAFRARLEQPVRKGFSDNAILSGLLIFGDESG
jgi:hypothetical protein